MKILFVTYDIPYPLDSGGKVRAYHLIKQLAQKHKITLFTYYRDKDQLDYLSELRKFCVSIRVFNRMQVLSLNHLYTTLTHPNLTAHISQYYHAELKKELEKELASGDYQVLHLESFYTSHLLDQYPVKKILGTENIEWQLYMEHARQQSSWLKLPLQMEALRTRSYEEKSWRRSDILLAVSQTDARKIKEKTGRPVYLVPNGVDLDVFQFKPKSKIGVPPTILFVGNFTYIQNQDAAQHLISDIFPQITKQIKGAKLLLVGKNIPKKLLQYGKSNIEFRDDVKDIRNIYYSSDILLAPLRVSSGTQFKILEAMAVGLPVVASRFGAEGLNVENNKQLLICDTPDNYVKKISILLRDKSRRKSIVDNARKHIENYYSWDKIGDTLRTIYAKLR